MNISLFNLFHLVAIVAPLVVGSSVNEACSKGGEDKVVTLLQFLLILPKSQRNSGCRSISEVLDVYHQRSDLASLFITGGRDSLTKISNG